MRRLRDDRTQRPFQTLRRRRRGRQPLVESGKRDGEVVPCAREVGEFEVNVADAVLLPHVAKLFERHAIVSFVISIVILFTEDIV